MHDRVDRGADLRPHGDERKARSSHQHERLEARQHVDGPVGVDGRERSVVTGVERLKHVEGFAAAHLADDDAVGTHPQRGAHQVAHAHRARAFCVGRPGLEPHDVGLHQPQLGGLFDGDDALTGGDRRRQRVEEGGLARARASGDQQVPAGRDGPAQERARRAGGAEGVEIDGSGAEAADGDARPVERERRDQGV